MERKLVLNCEKVEACNSVNGICKSCQPGYQKSFCMLVKTSELDGRWLCGWLSILRVVWRVDVLVPAACVAGRYGDNCGQSCGRCAGNQSCTHTNGSCLQCQANHQPPLCKGRSVEYYGLNCLATCTGRDMSSEVCFCEYQPRGTTCVLCLVNYFCHNVSVPWYR